MMCKEVIWLAAGVVMVPMVGCSSPVGVGLAPTPPPVSAPAAPAVSPEAPPLSEAAQGVQKIVKSGVLADVVKAYIENTPELFNLTDQNIAELQNSGVSQAEISEMQNHDKAAILSMQPTQSTNAPSDMVDPGTVLPNDENVYNNLSPYGSWQYVPDYGWSWQPDPWVSYNNYPWGWLSYGYWSYLPNTGWCWFPRSHFYDFDRYHGYNYYGYHYNHYGDHDFYHNRGRGFDHSGDFQHNDRFHGERADRGRENMEFPKNSQNPFNGGAFHQSAPHSSRGYEGGRSRGSGAFHGGDGAFHGGGGHGGGGGAFHGGGGHGGGGGAFHGGGGGKR